MKGVAIKGSRGGLRLTLGEEESLGELLAALTARLTESAAFFQGAEVTLDVGARELTPDDWQAIAALLLLSTIYCRYHYVIDVMAGVPVAVISVLSADWLEYKSLQHRSRNSLRP